MNLRAVILDIYDTLLAVGPPPVDAASRWTRLWQTALGRPVRVSLEQFARATEPIIAREHAAARARGVSYPEIVWPDIVREVLPELDCLPPNQLEEFVFQQMQMRHSVGLMPGAVDVLRVLREHEAQLGLASNAQAYTLRELEAAFTPVGLSHRIFDPEICFFSFEHGFSKPDPQVFRLLTARLHVHGISPQATLMVGNDLRHDLEPARARGWQTWHLTPESRAQANPEGDWKQLAHWLDADRPHRRGMD